MVARPAQECQDPLVLRQLPYLRHAYDLDNVAFYHEVTEQDDNLPKHILEWVEQPNGNILICSHHQTKVIAAGKKKTSNSIYTSKVNMINKYERVIKNRKINVIVPTKQHRDKGKRGELLRNIKSLTKDIRVSWKDVGVLHVSLLEDTPERMIWQIISRPKKEMN